jgi:hypothetical protein
VFHADSVQTLDRDLTTSIPVRYLG